MTTTEAVESQFIFEEKLPPLHSVKALYAHASQPEDKVCRNSFSVLGAGWLGAEAALSCGHRHPLKTLSSCQQMWIWRLNTWRVTINQVSMFWSQYVRGGGSTYRKVKQDVKVTIYLTIMEGAKKWGIFWLTMANATPSKDFLQHDGDVIFSVHLQFSKYRRWKISAVLFSCIHERPGEQIHTPLCQMDKRFTHPSVTWTIDSYTPVWPGQYIHTPLHDLVNRSTNSCVT